MIHRKPSKTDTGSKSKLQLLEPPLVLSDLLARVDNDREFLRELVDIFQEESCSLLQSLQRAVTCGDMKGVQTGAHTLKGMFANLSAPRAASSASRLEEMGRHRQRADLPQQLKTIESDLEDLSTALNTYLAGSVS